MNRRHAVLGLALGAVFSAALSLPALAGENTVILETKDGRVTIELRPEIAPKHVKQIKTLVGQGFYDGLKFHRVIDGFMVQTGDPNGNGTGGSKYPNLKQEFNAEPHVRGTCSMARTNFPHSANSQFFICIGDAEFLNNNYTVVGVVTDGMDAVDKIKKGSKSENGSVKDPDKIVKMELAEKAK